MPRKSRSETLSPIQHLILAAVSHPEHRLVRPEDIKPPTYRSALQALRRRGLITDSAAGKGSGRRPAGPVLSRAGLTHVAPAGREVQTAAQRPQPSVVRSPRPGSKLDCLVAMLARPDGASIDELITVLGWLPHTTRAALTGLRKRGYALTTIRTTGVPTRYRIAADEPHATDPVTSPAVEPATEEAAR